MWHLKALNFIYEHRMTCRHVGQIDYIYVYIYIYIYSVWVCVCVSIRDKRIL